MERRRSARQPVYDLFSFLTLDVVYVSSQFPQVSEIAVLQSCFGESDDSCKILLNDKANNNKTVFNECMELLRTSME